MNPWFLGQTRSLFFIGLLISDQDSEAKASNMVVVVVMEILIPINQTPNVSEFLHMAGDGYGSLLIEPVFFLCLLQKLHEKWVIEVNHRHHEPLLFLTLTHLNCHAPFWNILDELLLLPTITLVVVVDMVAM